MQVQHPCEYKINRSIQFEIIEMNWNRKLMHKPVR